MLLKLKNVCKEYINPVTETAYNILSDINLEVESGKTVAIVGPSGAGKSTLLNLIGALDNPSKGDVIFDDETISSCSDDRLADIRNKKIGFVFQLHHLLPQCNVLENVLVPTIPNKNKSDMIQRAKDLLIKVGLENHLSHFPAQLSGGELQRVAVVRALINNPKMILADEPTGSLDHKSAVNLTKLLIDINKDFNTTLVMVTHSSELAQMMEVTYKLQDGSLVKE